MDDPGGHVVLVAHRQAFVASKNLKGGGKGWPDRLGPASHTTAER